jgi:hypothetical protein
MINKAHKRHGVRLRADLVFMCLVQKAIRVSLNDRLERQTIIHKAETATQRVSAKWRSNTYGQLPKAARCCLVLERDIKKTRRANTPTMLYSAL